VYSKCYYKCCRFLYNPISILTISVTFTMKFQACEIHYTLLSKEIPLLEIWVLFKQCSKMESAKNWPCNVLQTHYMVSTLFREYTLQSDNGLMYISMEGNSLSWLIPLFRIEGLYSTIAACWYYFCPLPNSEAVKHAEQNTSSSQCIYGDWDMQ